MPAHAAGDADSIYTPYPQGVYPILRELHGELAQVRWNNDDRSVMNNLAPSELEEWYALYSRLQTIDADWATGTKLSVYGTS